VSLTFKQSSIEELRNDWDDLVLRSSAPNFFSTWEWAKAWWDVYGKGKREWIWALFSSGELVGIAPLYLSGKSLNFMGKGFADRLDFIIQRGKEELFFEYFLSFLLNDQSWELLDFSELSAQSSTLQYFKKFSPFSSLRILPQSKLPFLTLPSSWNDFLKRFNKKRRDKVNYYPRLLSRNFSWRIEEKNDEQLQEGLLELYRLHLSRFKKKLMPTPVLLPSFRDFHLRLAEELSGKNILKLFLLYLDEKPVAALYGFEFGDRFYFYLSGQDDHFRQYGLGFVLQTFAIKEAIEKGLKFFDFLRGMEAYKLHWKPEVEENVRILAHRGSIKSKINFNAKIVDHALVHQVKKWAGRI
jgi:hypothetical protein